MYANSRLNRLKRGPMINDVSSSNTRLDPRPQPSQPSKQSNGSQNMVQPMTVLTWHEQRLNKVDTQVRLLDEKLKELSNRNNDDVILPLIETIQLLEEKMSVLTAGFEKLTTEDVEDIDLKKNSHTLKEEVTKELAKVKLNVREK